MRIIRKIPRGLGRYEPLRHADHPRPTTRRQFLAQGFITGGASVLLPSVFSLMANPRIAQAAPSLGAFQSAVTACGIRELAKQTRIIVCCHDMQAKKFHHWWTAILADAQVFYWRLDRQQIVLTKPKSITFKNKYL